MGSLCRVMILGGLMPAPWRRPLADSPSWARPSVPHCSPGSARGPPYRCSALWSTVLMVELNSVKPDCPAQEAGQWHILPLLRARWAPSRDTIQQGQPGSPRSAGATFHSHSPSSRSHPAICPARRLPIPGNSRSPASPRARYIPAMLSGHSSTVQAAFRYAQMW